MKTTVISSWSIHWCMDWHVASSVSRILELKKLLEHGKSVKLRCRVWRWGAYPIACFSKNLFQVPCRQARSFLSLSMHLNLLHNKRLITYLHLGLWKYNYFPNCEERPSVVLNTDRMLTCPWNVATDALKSLLLQYVQPLHATCIYIRIWLSACWVYATAVVMHVTFINYNIARNVNTLRQYGTCP